MTSHPISSIPFFAAITLERAGYYGLRAIIVLYLISETINCSRGEAIELYGYGIGFMAISNLIGGALGFIGQPKILAVSGIGLQAIGAFIIAYSQTKEVVFLGLIIIGLGAGISRTNLLPFLGQLYHRSKLLDSGLMINYIMVNIGAFFSVILVSLVTSTLGFKLAFLLCGVIYAAAAALISLTNVSESESLEEPEKPNNVFPLILSLAVVGSAVFWLAFEFIIGNLYFLTDTVEDETITNLVRNSYNVNTVVVILFCVGLALYFTYKKVSITLQIGTGFILAGLAFLCLSAIDFQSEDNGTIKMALLGFFILQSLAEVLVGPPITSYIIRKLDVKYSPMVLAGFYFITALFQKFQNPEGYNDFNSNLTFAIIFMLVFAGVFIGFYLNGKKYDEEKADALDSEFDF